MCVGNELSSGKLALSQIQQAMVTYTPSKIHLLRQIAFLMQIFTDEWTNQWM